MNQPQNKSKNILKFIKSKFVFKKIFCNVNTKKALEMMTYNKSLKNKYNIDFNNYKIYSQKYSSIEIELILHPFNNKFNKENFINVFREEYASYFHIYFNNEEKEARRVYLTSDDIVKKKKLKEFI